jgi:hypothetical protein
MPDFYDPEAPQDRLEEVRAFIDAASWKIATTDKSVFPHSYMLRFQARRQHLVVPYERTVDFIVRWGVIRGWRNRQFRGIDIGDYSYWLMELADGSSATDIINRKLSQFAGWHDIPPTLI